MFEPSSAFPSAERNGASGVGNSREIFFPWAGFETLNAAQVAADKPPFANPRNTAAGTPQEPGQSRRRQSTTRLHAVQRGHSKRFYRKPHGVHSTGRGVGVATPSPAKRMVEVATTIEGILDFIGHWDSARHALPFAIDGIVIKVNAYSQQSELGMTASAPGGPLRTNLNLSNRRPRSMQ